VSSPFYKKILFYRSKNQIISIAIPSHSRGIAQGHQCGTGMRWPRKALLTMAPDVDGEIVWSRHPQAGVKFAAQGSAGDGGKSAGLTEEITYKP